MTDPTQPPASDQLSLSRSRRADTAVVQVTGELDVQTGAALRAALGEEINHPEIRCVVADLTAVRFMSSTGIAALVDAAHEARRHHRQLRVVVGDVHAVRRPLQISGVDRILELYEDTDRPLTDQS